MEVRFPISLNVNSSKASSLAFGPLSVDGGKKVTGTAP